MKPFENIKIKYRSTQNFTRRKQFTLRAFSYSRNLIWFYDAINPLMDIARVFNRFNHKTFHQISKQLLNFNYLQFYFIFFFSINKIFTKINNWQEFESMRNREEHEKSDTPIAITYLAHVHKRFGFFFQWMRSPFLFAFQIVRRFLCWVELNGRKRITNE